MSAATVFTVLTFKQEVPPMRVAEVRLSSVRVGGKEVPIADVGLFKSDKLLSKCNGLHVEQIEVEIVAPDCSPGVYRQLTGGGLPVEEFHEKQLANGLRLNACFPEHIKFFVTNRTDSPREFWMEMDGVSLPDWKVRGVDPPRLSTIDECLAYVKARGLAVKFGYGTGDDVSDDSCDDRGIRLAGKWWVQIREKPKTVTLTGETFFDALKAVIVVREALKRDL